MKAVDICDMGMSDLVQASRIAGLMMRGMRVGLMMRGKGEPTTRRTTMRGHMAAMMTVMMNGGATAAMMMRRRAVGMVPMPAGKSPTVPPATAAGKRTPLLLLQTGM